MTKKQKLKAVASAMKFHEWKNDKGEVNKTGYIISDNCEPGLKDILIEEIYNDDANTDVAYEIVSRACDVFADNDIDLDELKNLDLCEYANDGASVYTEDRLNYLTMWNQYDITEIVKECGCDVQTACAVWYDRRVLEVAEKLRDYILTNHE